MKTNYLILLLFLFIFKATTGLCTKHTVTAVGLTFSPASITANVGDTVVWTISGIHSALEVSQATWNVNGNTGNGGFHVPFGGGSAVMTTAKTYYYVCENHYSMGMKGTIAVSPAVTTTIITGSISSALCDGSAINVPYTITGTFNTGNVFTAQLSDAGGSFASPVNIGLLTSTASGTINAAIPSNTPAGTGYRIRVVSSNPVVTGSDNGSNITVNASPVVNAGSNSPVCSGCTLDLHSSLGTSYSWSGPNGFSSTLQNPSITNAISATAGAYTVTITGSNGCTASASTAVAVLSTLVPTLNEWGLIALAVLLLGVGVFFVRGRMS